MAVPAAELPEFEAKYRLHRGLLPLGQVRVDLSYPAPGHYRYETRSVTTGVVSLFDDTRIREVSEGRVTDDGYRPQRYRYRRRGDNHREMEIHFEWAEGEAVNDASGRPWRMALPAGAKDRVVTGLQLMADLADDARSLRYKVADGGYLRPYRLQVVGRERVTVPAGEFEAVKVHQHSGDGEAYLWCAPALRYLAVKILRQDEEQGEVTLVLDEVEGL